MNRRVLDQQIQHIAYSLAFLIGIVGVGLFSEGTYLGASLNSFIASNSIYKVAHASNNTFLDKLYSGSSNENTNENSLSESSVVEPASVFEEALKPIYADPVNLYFDEEHSMDLDIIEVGVDSDGKLENPEDWNVAGWYYKSSKPGELGNMIVNAHYDDNYGRPAAFWKLKNVKVNDKVFVVDSLGKEYTYEVTETFYVDINDPERLKIFDERDDVSELTLITCGGIWDLSVGTYNKRLVVKAELQNSEL